MAFKDLQRGILEDFFEAKDLRRGGFGADEDPSFRVQLRSSGGKLGRPTAPPTEAARRRRASRKLYKQKRAAADLAARRARPLAWPPPALPRLASCSVCGCSFATPMALRLHAQQLHAA